MLWRGEGPPPLALRPSPTLISMFFFVFDILFICFDSCVHRLPRFCCCFFVFVLIGNLCVSVRFVVLLYFWVEVVIFLLFVAICWDVEVEGGVL